LKKNVSETTVDDKVKMDDAVILEGKASSLSLYHWLKKSKFYLFGLYYMCVRLNSNIFGTFLPFYLIYVLKLSPSTLEDETIPFSVALVPLVIYFSSTLISVKITWLYTKIGRRSTLFTGTTLSILSLGSLLFLNNENSHLIYFSSIFIGISQSMILSTGINLISDVIGTKTDSGAIVFGIYSFLDKITAGIIIYLIANLPCFQPKGALLQS